MATVDIGILQAHEYIKSSHHPELDLIVWNYTSRCQFDRVWDEYTRMCRGLITDGSGKIIARPFPKFFNVGETEDTLIYRLPATIPEVREKHDGSLGVQLYNGVKVHIATRGSFTSDQAVWATNWVQEQGYTRGDFQEGYTYLYEIIYPENRIVVNYGDRKELVLLAVINTEDGSELDVDVAGLELGIDTPRIINKDIWVLEKEVQTLDRSHEGYVLRYPPDDDHPTGLRVKMKGWEYIRMHKAIFQCSSTMIWELLSAGMNISILVVDLPDELHDWVREWERKLQDEFSTLLSRGMEVTEYVSDLPTRKDQAIFINTHHKELAPIVFCLLDGKDPDGPIWKMIKPGYERPI